MAGLTSPLPLELPRLLVATDGRAPISADLGRGVLLRDLDLATLVGAAEAADVSHGPALIVVDLDSVEGLEPDPAAVRFVIRRLGINAVMSRRAAAAARAAELGALGLLRIFAFDSTGLGRSLQGLPEHAGIGAVISPGPVLAHMSDAETARLPRPVFAYGLIDTPQLAQAALARADSVVVSADCEARIAASLGI